MHYEADVLVTPHYAADGVVLENAVRSERKFVHLGEGLQNAQLVLVVSDYMRARARDRQMLAIDAGAISKTGRREVLPIRSRRSLLENLQALVRCSENVIQLDFLPLVPAPIVRQSRNAVFAGGKVASEIWPGTNFVCNNMQADLVAVASRLALLGIVLLLDVGFYQQGLRKLIQAEQTNGLAVHARPLRRIVVTRAATAAMRF